MMRPLHSSASRPDDVAFDGYHPPQVDASDRPVEVNHESFRVARGKDIRDPASQHQHLLRDC